LVVVGNGFGVRQSLMVAVACGGVRQCVAVRLFPLVVVRQAAEKDEKTKLAFYPFGGKPPKAQQTLLWTN
jgi:hypothetical protein